MISTTREAGDARDRCQREVQVLQATIQNEVEEFEMEFKDKVAELREGAGRSLIEIERSAKLGSTEALRLHLGAADGVSPCACAPCSPWFSSLVVRACVPSLTLALPQPTTVQCRSARRWS